ncbi:HAD family hydrolase [Thiolapillus brandeum]|uniref:HAD family hydrolase n=1 Tax=Thiolapillus brandeum TaxID=1076588 RepID=A0A7U6JIC1_9GAMM|nr:HAD family hydrolase [Thiolapillus brandeum]BAO44648.1 HAD family hydrolase [Thiolapillus brandeum]
MAELEALIFDVDGTLADTEKDGHRVAFNKAFAGAGLDWDWSVDIYGDLLTVTGGKERMKFYLKKYRPDFSVDGDLDAFVADLHAAKTEYYKALMVDPGLPLRPGVERLLREARDAGLRLAIATTTTPANVTALLKNSLAEDAEDWFEVIAAGDLVPAKKPAPDIYVWAMEQMNLTPEQCLAFEDSDNGVKSVLGSGISSLLVTVNDYTRNQDFSGATLVVDNLGEPGQPCRVLAGPDLVQGQVDIQSLKAIHEHATG